MMALDQHALEAAARAACKQGGFDPDEVMPNDGPRWRYYVLGAEATITAYLAALGDGWRLVPVELADALIARWARDPERREFSRAQYAAMLAAAPTPTGREALTPASGVNA